MTSEKVDHLLTAQKREDLDRLLVADPAVGATRLAWLTTPAVEASAAAVKLAIDKLLFLRRMDAHLLDLSMLPRERRRFLATLGRRSTVQGLRRREERRFPILLALVAQSAVDQLDEAIALFDQAVSARESRAKAKTNEALRSHPRTCFRYSSVSEAPVVSVGDHRLRGRRPGRAGRVPWAGRRASSGMRRCTGCSGWVIGVSPSPPTSPAGPAARALGHGPHPTTVRARSPRRACERGLTTPAGRA